jgi:hypothetical protein
MRNPLIAASPQGTLWEQTEEPRGAVGCRSDWLLGEREGDFVLHLESGDHVLKSADDKGRHQLISAIRGGQHAELDVTATTFKQKDGVPNRRYLRHRAEGLDAFAKSFGGMPMLIDHASYSQRARMGTIRSSELHTHGGTGWSSFKMGLRVVKPEGVISMLDGTMDRFSIGWKATGPVLCTAHRCDVTSAESCGCWPGDRVSVDGVDHVVEFEFQSAEGTEVSAVNVPAVKGTRVEDVRAALAAELHLVVPTIKETSMLTRLAAALGLAALTAADEDRAVATLERERTAAAQERTARLAAEQERDAARAEVTTLKVELNTAKTTTLKSAIDAVLDTGYREGRLCYGRDSEGKALPDNFEPMLRQLAEHSGLDKLRATLSSMPVRIPLGQRALDGVPQPALTDFDAAPIGQDGLTDAERDVARQLGLKPEDMVATKRRLAGGY